VVGQLESMAAARVVEMAVAELVVAPIMLVVGALVITGTEVSVEADVPTVVIAGAAVVAVVAGSAVGADDSEH
jgi:hypothetical protein